MVAEPLLVDETEVSILALLIALIPFASGVPLPRLGLEDVEVMSEASANLSGARFLPSSSSRWSMPAHYCVGLENV